MATFAEIAVELKMLAFREAYGVEALEILAARTDQKVFKNTLDEVRLSARLAGEAHEIIKALIGHEREIRALIAFDQAEAERSEPARQATA